MVESNGRIARAGSMLLGRYWLRGFISLLSRSDWEIVIDAAAEDSFHDRKTTRQLKVFYFGDKVSY